MSPTDPEAVIEFPEGLPGFESCRRYVLLSGPTTEPLAIIRGLGPGAPSFLTVDPLRVAGGFRADLGKADLARLRAEAGTPLLYLAIVSADASGAVTANLRAPLVINPANLVGIQLIAAESAFAFDHPLSAA
jgi:flagellar assembly factor FliW